MTSFCDPIVVSEQRPLQTLIDGTNCFRRLISLPQPTFSFFLPRSLRYTVHDCLQHARNSVFFYWRSSQQLATAKAIKSMLDEMDKENKHMILYLGIMSNCLIMLLSCRT